MAAESYMDAGPATRAPDVSPTSGGNFDFSKRDISDAATGAGGVLEAWASIRGGYVSKALGLLQANIFQTNADILKNQADTAELGVDYAYAKGRQQEADVRYAGENVEGQQRHWYASNHLDPAYGSPLVHQVLTATQVEHDVGIVRASSQIAAADAKTRSVNFLAASLGQSGQAAVGRVKAGEAVTAGYIGAGTAFLKTAGKLAAAGGG